MDKQELWVFHVLSSDSVGSSAVWAAQRVPDGHVTVVPNIFVIREIDVTDTENYLASANIFDIAKKNGWWDGKETFDFTKVYSGGEYNHRYYSGRRWWGAMKLMVPDLEFPSNYTNLRDDAPYPFSVRFLAKTRRATEPCQTVMVSDVFVSRPSIGHPLDLTKDLLLVHLVIESYDGEIEQPGQPGVKGSWERSRAIYRTDYSHILEIDQSSTDRALPCGLLQSVAHKLLCAFLCGPDSLQVVWHRAQGGVVDRQNSAMWAFRYVQQIALRYTE